MILLDIGEGGSISLPDPPSGKRWAVVDYHRPIQIDLVDISLTGKEWAKTLVAGEMFRFKGVEWVVVKSSANIWLVKSSSQQLMSCGPVCCRRWADWDDSLNDASDDTVEWVVDRREMRKEPK